MLEAIFHNPFLQNALLAGLLSSIASGIMGSYVVVKKLSSLSGSIAHSVLGGIGLFLYLSYELNLPWLNPLFGSFFAALLSAIGIGVVHLKYKQKEDAIIAAIWSSGMAVGIIFITLVPGYKSDFYNFLFGNIIWTSATDLWTLGGLDFATIILTLVLYPRFLAVCFDEELSILQKLPLKSLYLLLLSFIAVAIVLLIQTIGIILVIALLTITPTLAMLFTDKLYKVMLLSTLFTAFFNISGTLIAYRLDLPPGPVIALLAAIIYITSLKLKKSILITAK